MLHCHRWARRGETSLKQMVSQRARSLQILISNQMRDHPQSPTEIVKPKPIWILGTRAFWVNTPEATSDVMGCPAQVTTADIHQRIDSSGFHQPCDVLQVTGLQYTTPQGFSCTVVLKWNSRSTHFDLGLHPLV